MSEGGGLNGWEIYRLEFAFLNPEEYRWQMFQYWPAEEGAVPSDDDIHGGTEATYRRQAQKLLSWVSKTLKLQSHSFKQKNKDVSIDGSKIKKSIKLSLQRDGVTDIDTAFTSLIDQYKASIKTHFDRDGLSYPIKDIFDQIKIGKRTIYIDSKFAIDLISSLYISYDWDIFGRLAYCQSDLEKINASMLGSISYALSYPKTRKKGGLPNILGYPVEIVHLSSSKLRKVVHMKDDYFSFCNKIQDVQKNWYRVYGHIIDELNKDTADSEEHVYIRCFPLRICGYDHFLQIFLRPTEGICIGHFRGDIPELFSPRPRKGVPSLVVFKECLRELIVQMHVATFQRRVLEEFSRDIGCAGSDDNCLMTIFARHAPNLVKMEGLWVNDTYYTYDASGDLEFKQWQATTEGNAAWKSRPICGGVNPHFACLESSKIIANVPWEDDYKDLASLLDGTGEMRLEEQWQWLKNAVPRRTNPASSVTSG
jgi:hypothetical protein